MAKLFYRNTPVVGLDITNTGVKIMAIDPKRWLVLGYGSVDLEPIKVKASLENGDPYLADNIKILLKERIIGKLGSKHVVVGIPTSRTYSRTFMLPPSAEKTLHEAVLLEADQYIPIPSDTLSIDSQIIAREKKQLTVLMAAIPKTIIENVVRAIELSGLEPILVEPGMSAVGRLLTATEDGDLPTVIVDIGPAGTDIAILDRNHIQVTGGVAIGGNTFTLDISKDLGLDLETAHQYKILNGLNTGPRQQKMTEALKPSLERIIVEVKKVMRYYEERISSDRKLEQVLIVGSGSNVPGIGEYFTNALVMPARVASPWQKLDFGKLQDPPKQFRSRYITVAGLASVLPEAIWR